jgi:5-methylcytosine-specific restriction endonuclease McrA
MSKCAESDGPDHQNGAVPMTDRIALSKRIRFEVFKRDRFCCQYCGRHPPDVILEIDHIIPVCDGGDTNEANLLTACFDCNRGKAANPLTRVPQSLADKATEIAEHEEQLRGYREVFEQQRDRIEADMWKVAEALFGEYECEDGIRRDWLSRIKFFNDKIGFEQVFEAAEIAAVKWLGRAQADEWRTEKQRRFAYFCGVCWRKIKGQPSNDEGLSS